MFLLLHSFPLEYPRLVNMDRVMWVSRVDNHSELHLAYIEPKYSAQYGRTESFEVKESLEEIQEMLRHEGR